MSANPRVKCDVCGGGCKRLLGAGAGIIFKGSGFYETDYKRKSGDAERSSTGGGPPKTESKSEGKSEGKSEAKSEAKSDANSGSKTSSKKGSD